MTVLHTVEELAQIPGPVALAVGVFDGLHVGHLKVIETALIYAKQHQGRCVVLTFDPHPLQVLRPDLAPKLLCSTPHRLRILEQLGVDHTLLCCFDEMLANTEPEQFIKHLVKQCQPLGLITVGSDWRFGKAGVGNTQNLQLWGQRYGFEVIAVPEVQMQGQKISSTRIRSAVANADFEAAETLLGRPYSILGQVQLGRQLGRTLNFPTANLDVGEEPLPTYGVYAVQIMVGQQLFNGVANLGKRPTVDGVKCVFEVHLFDFSEDLYDQQIEVLFRRKLRNEIKFESLDALQAQIARDVEQTRAWFNAGII